MPAPSQEHELNPSRARPASTNSESEKPSLPGDHGPAFADVITATHASATPGGPDRRGFSLRVAGITIGVEPIHPSLHLLASPSSRRFLVDPGHLDLLLTADFRPLAAEPGSPLVFDSGGPWRLYDDHGCLLYRIFDSRLGPSPYKEARLDSDLRAGAVQLNENAYLPLEPVDPLEFPLDELLFQLLLSSRDGFEMHACGIIAPSGKGYVFAGHSGDGKTTTARLRAGGSTERPGTETRTSRNLQRHRSRQSSLSKRARTTHSGASHRPRPPPTSWHEASSLTTARRGSNGRSPASRSWSRRFHVCDSHSSPTPRL